jgi:VWFA-related protein
MTMRPWVMATSVLATAWLAAVAGQQPLRLEIVSPVDGAFVSDEVTVEARILPAERRDEVTDVTFYVDGTVLCRTKDVRQPKCAWDAGAVIRAHAIRVVAALASGEPLVATSRTQAVDVAEAVDVQVVQVNASVQDRRGNFVTGLTRDQFRLTEEGRPQTIVHFGAAETPLEVVVAMDISLSMDAAMPDLRAGVKQFLASLNPVDRVTLVAFNTEPFVLTRREADPAVRERAVNLLRAFGSTSLYDVIIHSIALLSRQSGRRALVVFSDGDDQSSQATLAQVERAIKGSDATVFMVGLGRAREARLRQTLTALAAPSGGRTILADRPADLGRAFGEILQELKHQYLLAFSPATTARDGAWRRLAVETPGLDTRIRAREGYFAPRQ